MHEPAPDDGPILVTIEYRINPRQAVRVGRRHFELAEGESLHTENSYKFTVEGLRALAVRAGFRPGPVWTDDERLFSVHWLHAPT